MAASAKYRQLYVKAGSAWSRWTLAQESGCSSMRTAGNILARLKAMQTPSCYGSLAGDHELQDQALAKQLVALEEVLASVRKSM